MTAIRQKNVTAAQWNANGSAVESTDLTKEENVVFGSNVFSIKTQKERLRPMSSNAFRAPSNGAKPSTWIWPMPSPTR